jgi:predicted regulator of Ras-like GTPase activity (Roadblock/LC7/MglB family)
VRPYLNELKEEKPLQSSKSVENVLDDIIRAEFYNDPMVESVAVVSKSGLIITGDPARLPSKPEMFSAMVSVIFTSAESSRTDAKKEKLEHIIGVYKSKKIFVYELSASLMIALTAEREADDAAILERLKKAAARTKDELVWLR